MSDAATGLTEANKRITEKQYINFFILSPASALTFSDEERGGLFLRLSQAGCYAKDWS